MFCVILCVTLTSFHFDEPKRIKTVVIDAGHGGQDPGCNGVIHKEKDVSLAVALRLGKLIEENCPDVKVIYTRKTDIFIPLEERAAIANRAKADLFICVHCNAAGKPVMIKDKKTGKLKVKTYTNKRGKKVPIETPNPIPFGSETYVMGIKNEEGKMKVAQRENSAILLEDNYEQKYGGFDPESEESYIIMSNYTSAYVIQSAQLALKIQAEYTKKAGRVDKGVHRQSLLVLWKTAMPGILTEIGFLTNPLEEEFLGSEKGQKYIAASIFNGFRKYKDEFEGKKKVYDDEFEKMEPLENENLKAGNTGKPIITEEYSIEEENGKSDSIKTVVKDEPKNPEIMVRQAHHDSIINKNKEFIEKKDSVKTQTPIVEKEKEPVVEKEKEPVVVKEKEKVPIAIGIKPGISDEGPDVIEFKVQFASSDKELDLKENKFSAIENGGFYKVGSFLKYTSGKFKTMNEAAKHQKKLNEAGFKDCFVVAFRNGQRIDVKEAKLLSEKK